MDNDGCGLMNKKIKILIKIFVVLCVLVLIVDMILVLYKKYENDQKRTFFHSLNGYLAYQDSYYGVGSNNINKNSYEKAILTKYNSKYKKVWSSSFDSRYNSTYYQIARDGKFLLAVGSYEKTKDENKNSLRTALFVKYDTNGKIIFQKDLQILGNSKFTNVLVLDDAYLVVGQSIYPNDVLGNEDTGGAIIIKYSKSGKVLWRKNIGGNKSGLFNDVIQVGKYLYAVGKDATRYGILVKYDLNGEKIKSVSYAKTDTLGFSSIVKKKDRLYVVGAKKINPDDEYDHDIDGLVVEYNLDLEKVNEQTYQNRKGRLERFNQIILDRDQNLVVVGHQAVLDRKNSTKEENVYYYQGLLVKYDDQLKEQNAHLYHSDQDDYFTDIIEGDQNYIVSGYRKYNTNRYEPIVLEFKRDF